MQIEKYTDRLKTLIQSAQTLAMRSGHQQFTPLHLLKALLDDEDRLAGNLIDASGATASQVAQAVDRELDKLPRVEGQGAGQIYLAPESARVFDQAEQMAQKAGDQFVTVEYMLLALATAASAAADLLKKTVLYKVSHHGSRNAKVKDKGLERMMHRVLPARLQFFPGRSPRG